MLDTRPNHTIYINNLNEKIKKDGKCSIVIVVNTTIVLMCFINYGCSFKT